MTYHTGDQHTVYVSKLKHTKNNLNTFHWDINNNLHDN